MGDRVWKRGIAFENGGSRLEKGGRVWKRGIVFGFHLERLEMVFQMQFPNGFGEIVWKHESVFRFPGFR